MPRFSAFTPFGCFAFSGKPSRLELVYKDLAILLAPYDLSLGSEAEAELYATARTITYMRMATERVANANSPEHCSPEFLPALEEDYGERPLSTATNAQRRARLSFLSKLPQGFVFGALIQALTDAMGSDFEDLTQVAHADRTTVGGTSVGTFARPEIPLRRFVTTEPLFAGGARSVGYANMLGGAPEYLAVGDYVVIDAADPVNAERVQVTAIGEGQEATFAVTKTHDEGCSMTVGHCPLWASTRHTTFVVLTASAAANPKKRAIVNDILRRVCPSINTWHIVGSTGPFTIGTSRLDATPLVST